MSRTPIRRLLAALLVTAGAVASVATSGPTPPPSGLLSASADHPGLVLDSANRGRPADAAYRTALGVLQWIPRGEFVEVSHVSDAADLLALPALALAVLAGWSRR